MIFMLLSDFVLSYQTIRNSNTYPEERIIEEKKRREEEIRRWELQEKRDKEKERLKLLIAKADDFYQAQKLYEYIAAIKEMLPNVQDDKKKELTQYLAWAKQKADWLNPLVGRVDEVLGSRHERIAADVKEEDDE